MSNKTGYPKGETKGETEPKEYKSLRTNTSQFAKESLVKGCQNE